MTAIEEAVEVVLSEGLVRPADLGGNSSTCQVGEAIVQKLKKE
jgi:isocitrate/isopropylmalate dehydrogenase